MSEVADELVTDTPLVIKYGGNAMLNSELQRSFAADIVAAHRAGLRPVVVHGGGPQIGAMLTALGMDGEFRGGYRVTTPDTIATIRMVLLGQVGRELVQLINEHAAAERDSNSDTGSGAGPRAVGLTGEDAGTMTATRRTATVDGEATDIGLVGDVTSVDTRYLHLLLDAGYIPVISTIAPDAAGVPHNINADTAAAAVAAALGSRELIVLTDVPGLYTRWPDRGSLTHAIGSAALAALLPTLDAGMRPKMEACLRAVTDGVAAAHVIDGRDPHAVGNFLATRTGGTAVTFDGAGETATEPEQS